MQGCDSSFSKELSSELKFPGHLELQFHSSSSYGMHELSYSSVQFHLLGIASKQTNGYQTASKPVLRLLPLPPCVLAGQEHGTGTFYVINEQKLSSSRELLKVELSSGTVPKNVWNCRN